MIDTKSLYAFLVSIDFMIIGSALSIPSLR